MNLPTPHQTLLFSATMPVEVEALAADYLNKPVKVKVGAVSIPTANVAQHPRTGTRKRWIACASSSSRRRRRRRSLWAAP